MTRCRTMLNEFMMGMLIVFAVSAFADEPNIVMIAHPGVTDTLTQDEVQQIFLGRKTRWSDDRKITFLLYNHDAALDMFLKTYVKKTPFQYKNFWKNQVFTGKGRMPKTFKQLEDVMAFVSETEGAVSFAFADEVAGSEAVKIILIQE